ncbi:MAG: hypothetical protein EHM35_21290 [Planctomycetaceae bacterium]|nr:MAG: hypothetical protein EHM35_21290 [Planctomycetaceae bacterium]
MTEHNRHFDGVDRHVSPQFGKDLRALFEPPGAVPQEVDKAIADMAGTHLASRKHVSPRRLVIPMRWAAVAAAAVIVLCTILYTTVTHDTPHSAFRIPHSVDPGRADIDSSGRVDILDAFRLARHVESRGQAQTEWDFNDDGLVDRQDVDIVAFAAVRLDKGV